MKRISTNQFSGYCNLSCSCLIYISVLSKVSDKLSHVLSVHHPKYTKCRLLSDFNVPINLNSPAVSSLLSLFNEFNSANFVTTPTMTSFNILDLIVFDIHGEVEVKVQTSTSDHHFVVFQFIIDKSKSEKVE